MKINAFKIVTGSFFLSTALMASEASYNIQYDCEGKLDVMSADGRVLPKNGAILGGDADLYLGLNGEPKYSVGACGDKILCVTTGEGLPLENDWKHTMQVAEGKVVFMYGPTDSLATDCVIKATKVK